MNIQKSRIDKRVVFKDHLSRIGGLFIFLEGLFFLCFCFAQPYVLGPEPGDAIVVGSIADVRTLVPILASDSSSAEICSLLFNGLLKYDKNINLIGDLADSWEVKEDGLKIIFYLKKGVRWHDGVEFTAEDVKFTFEKLIDPHIKTPYSGDFLKVKKVDVIDPYTLEVVYKEPFSPGLASWGMWIMPKHILEKEDLNSTDFSAHPVGTGPYKLKKWKHQEKIELIANLDYFEGRPMISRYIYRVIPDQSTLFLELETQGIDYCGLSPLQFIRQTNNAFFAQNYKKFRTHSFSYSYLGYNLRDEKFKDKLVRQALNYAVDKKEIIKIVLLGMGEVSTGPFVPQSWVYNAEVDAVDFNPRKALELLKQAGWQDTNHDGYLDKDGKIFEFTIITNQGNESRLKTAEIIQKYLKDIGIRVKIKVLEWSSLLSEFLDKRRFEAVLLGWSLSRDPDCYDIWHSSKTKEGEFNFMHYQNKDVDELMEEARRTFDINERKKFYHKIHQLIYEQQPYMFLYVVDSLEIVSSRFKGIEPAPIGIGHNFIQWWVPKEEQRYKTYFEK